MPEPSPGLNPHVTAAKRFLRTVLLLLVFTRPGHSETARYLAGNPGDVNPALHGPALHIQGGGTDVDAAFQWMFDQVRGCTDCPAKLDVVVLSANSDGEYNEYLLAMKGVDSVETIVITSPEESTNEDVIRTIRNAEVIFFEGGDQCHYVTNFKGTPVEAAVESVYERGGGISGTSAGDAIQGEFVYDACHGSTQSYEALANPYHESISFTRDFFHWKYLEGTMTDQHLVERNRIGRTFAFLARQIRDGKTKSVLGAAADRETSMLLDKKGLALISGKGPAYFILADHMPEVCEPNKPLTYSNFKIWKVDAGGTFDLKNRPDTGYYTRSVVNGVIDQDPYSPEVCEVAAIAKEHPAEVKQALETFMRACPRTMAAYRYVESTGDTEFMARKAVELRRFLNYARGDELDAYAILWPLELKSAAEKDRAAVREQIVEDTRDLRLAGMEESKAILAKLRKIETPEGIETIEHPNIGGAPQWISIRGANRSNPVLLVIHGGPGSPLMPASWAFQKPWEDYFTVVQWDQRGAGKNYAYSDLKTLAPTVTLDRMVQDSEEMVAYLRNRLHKVRITVLGVSWGTEIGLRLAQKRPEWLHACVGAGLPAAYDSADLKLLFSAAELGPEYYREDVGTLGEGARWIAAQLRESTANSGWNRIGRDFKTPILLIVGRNESKTGFEAAKSYFDRIKAPRKKFVAFERSSHFPMIEEPGRFLVTLVQEVLPLAK